MLVAAPSAYHSLWATPEGLTCAHRLRLKQWRNHKDGTKFLLRLPLECAGFKL